ncbi:hypothetical protein LTS18_006005 [Coniosporium uncinatum]|uniref:Uncharacterized protein n=1 Tax=Coniosporium uncinatum TaxID=93489 RepID=A0ACC3DY99_9PEZI|nr:hypothetical protein LTS18_006005 [Coniosporium uncinatum]
MNNLLNNIGNTLAEAGEGLHHFRQGSLGTFNGIHKAVKQSALKQCMDEVQQWAADRVEELKIAAGEALDTVYHVECQNMPQPIAQWIEEHPKQTTFLVAGGSVFFAPFLITVPVLGMLGFVAAVVPAGRSFCIYSIDLSIRRKPLTGNFTGSAAAAMQAMIGDVAAGSLFALMQTAGAGAGLAVLNILVKAGAATAVGVEATKAVKEHIAKEEQGLEGAQDADSTEGERESQVRVKDQEGEGVDHN